MIRNLSDNFDNPPHLRAKRDVEKLIPTGSIPAQDYSINSNEQVKTKGNERVTRIVETFTISEESPSVNFNNSKASNKDFKDNGIEFDSYIPRKLDNKTLRVILRSINDDIARIWRSKKPEYAFDIDIKMEFQRNLEDECYEIVYTVFVPNLNKEDIPIVWNDLRKSYNNTIERKKRNLKKYREYLKKLSDMTYIQLDW